MSKADIVSEFVLNKTQVDKIDFYLSSIIKHNKHTNLVGKSTIENIWDRHVLDCLQLTKHITNKKLKILDLGTGAGLPGVLLSIVGYQRVLMIDSVKKKTDFGRQIIKELSLAAKIQNKRIEKQQNILYAMGVNENDESNAIFVSTSVAEQEFKKYIKTRWKT